MNYLKKLLMLFRPSIFLVWALILFCTIDAFGQTITVRGNVTDMMEGFTLPGVNILEVGTTNGTISDLNGDYTITVSSPDAQLRFTYVGYIEEQIAVSGRSVINLEMAPSIEMLSEMVVVGYGVQRRDDLTGSVAIVSGDDLTRANYANLGQALQGRAAGVSVTTSSGQPGSQTSIKIRGIGSISSGAEPLYVIDGIITSNRFVVNAINPSDIESISVLKDASAAAIYGARGANGVIVIKTKRGTKDRTDVTFSSYGGFTETPARYNLMNADEYASFSTRAWESFIARNPNFPMPSYFTDESRMLNGSANTSWQDEILQRGLRQNYDLSTRGGTENFNYLFSANYYDETGTLINTGYNRITARFNSELKANSWLTFGQTFSYGQEVNDYTSHRGRNPWSTATLASPFMNLFNENNKGGYAGPVEIITGPNDQTNPVAEQMLNTNRQKINQLLTNFYGQVNIFQGLSFRTELGVNNRTGIIYRYSPEYELARAWNNPTSELREENNSNVHLMINNLLTYENSFGNHNMNILLGQSAEKSNFRSFGVTGRDLAFGKTVMSMAQNISNANGIEVDERYSSYFARGLYDYQGKYLLTATIRRDGSSKFGPENRIGYFPSFSLGWKINEDLLPNVEQIDMLKLRFGWGQTGNDNIGNFLYIDRINNPLETRYPFGVNESIHYGGTIIRSFANTFIKWEATEMTNIGVDAWLFGGKIELTAEYYYKNQSDMLIELPQFHFFGRQQESGRLAVNIGEVSNRGFEFNASYRKMEGDFNFRINANATTVKNRVEYLPNDEPVFGPGGNTITMVGHPIGSFYGWVAEAIFQPSDFQHDEDGNIIVNAQGNYLLNPDIPEHVRGTSPGDIKFRDLDGDDRITTSDRKIIGNPFPKMIYGMNFDFYYKNFDMVVFWEGIYGNDIYNGIRSQIGIATEPLSQNWNRLKDVEDFWTFENQSTTMTRAFLTDPNNNARMSSWFIEDGSYLRLKNLQLGYTLPKNLTGAMGIQSARFYVSATNLLTITRYSGLDPELNADNPLSSGFDYGSYPVPKSYMMGIQVNF
jgi:TonB-dependent starch-binding outer membrane protein SusC